MEEPNEWSGLRHNPEMRQPKPLEICTNASIALVCTEALPVPVPLVTPVVPNQEELETGP